MGKRQKTARCLYCGAAGVTKEHVLARSLTKLFDLGSEPGQRLVLRHEYQHPELGIVRAPKRASTLAYTACKFCAACNSGWMNDADQAVRPTLQAFAENRPIQLLPAQQEQLAFWTTKTVLGVLSEEPEEYRFAAPELYHELYRTRSPLTGSQVWLGGNEHGHIAWHRAPALTFRDLPGVAQGFGASLSFGYGVVHLMFHGSEDWALRLRHEALRLLRQVWPTQREMWWPPTLLIKAPDLTPLPLIVKSNSRFVPRDLPAEM